MRGRDGNPGPGPRREGISSRPLTTPALLAALLAAAMAAGAAPAAPAPAPAAGDGLPEAEPLGVRVWLDRPEARLGEPFELAVEVRHRAEERYTLPAPAAVEPFRVLGTSCPRRDEGDEAVTTCTLRLALFDLGRHELPGLTLAADTPAGPRALRVPGPGVVGAGILDPAAPPEALALKDLAPPAPLLVPNAPLAIGLAAATLALAAGWLGQRAWRRRALRAAEPPPPLPPHERFARQLDALEVAGLAAQGRGREHFFRLSEHVREYLGAVTGQNALDLTSAELLARLSFQPDPRLDLGALRAFLESSDLVKFARAPAGRPEAAAGLRFARALLEAARPAPARATEGGAAGGRGGSA